MVVPMESKHDCTQDLDPRFTFCSLFVHAGNELACAAALRVSETPGQVYNPLFIHSRQGCGLTHLIHAIGNDIIKSNPGMSVLYANQSMLYFMLINAIKANNADKLRREIRSVDVFLVDDVQSFAGERRWEEEFIHTFDALFERGKQIVVSADCFPTEIPNLDVHLQERFQSGLVADLHSPDQESRVEILKLKSSLGGLDLPGDVIQFLAASIDTNVSDLESAMIRVLARASIEHVPVSVDLAKKILESNR